MLYLLYISLCFYSWHWNKISPKLFSPTLCFLLIKAPYLWLRHLKALYIVCQRFSQTVAPPFQPSGGHIEPSRELSIPPSPTQLLSVYNKLQTSTHALRRETEWLEFKGLFTPNWKKKYSPLKGKRFSSSVWNIAVAALTWMKFYCSPSKFLQDLRAKRRHPAFS